MRTADAPDDFRPAFAHFIVPSDMVRVIVAYDLLDSIAISTPSYCTEGNATSIPVFHL